MGTNLRTMTKRKTKKKRFEPFFDFFRNRLSPFDRRTSVHMTIAFVGLVWLAGAVFGFEPGARTQTTSGSHPRVFVIFTTVFNEQGFAFPGARVRVRRSDQKKFRWEGISDHQGEVAFRVPPGEEYDLVIEARGFKTETRKIDAQQDNQADLTIRMLPQTASHSDPKSETEAGGKP